MSNKLNSLDLILFVVVLLITFLAVLYGNKQKRHSSSNNTRKQDLLDHLIMGRQLSLPLFVATLVATWYGGLFGVTQIAFESGIYNFITQGIFWYITYIFFAVFMVKKVRSYGAITLPELIGHLFGPKAAFIGALFNLLNIIPITYTISLGVLCQALWGIELLPSMLISISFVSLYSIFGGFRAVVFSDLVQFIVMCTSVALVLIFSVYQFGGIEFLRSHLPEDHFSPLGGHSIATTMVWGLIAISTLVDPNFYQRAFAAKSDQVATRGILISTIIWVIFDICTTFGALYARATMPELDSTTAYLYYAIEILPHGLRGFVLAGIVATILSTIDSYLFIAGTTLTYDLFPTTKNSVWRTRIGTLIIATLSITIALAFEGNIKTVWKTLGSYSTACLLFPVLWGYLFPKSISDKQFIFVCSVGVVATTYWRLGTDRSIDELYIGVLSTSLSLLSLFIYNIFFRRKIEE